MSIEPAVADDDTGRPGSAGEPAPGTEPADRGRPKVSGDLPTVLEAAPMFRRAVGGYDRFQVDTYVRWAEDELAAAEREREHLVAHQVRTQKALDDARELLTHSVEGGDFLRVSSRIGSMLAAAADEADDMRAEGEAARTAARAEAEELAARGTRALADAEAEAQRTVTAAVAEAEELKAGARRVLDDAERTGEEARMAAEARLERARVVERHAAVLAEQIRQRAVEEASVARLQARDDAVRLLLTAREQQRRADHEAAATRQRLDREAAARRAALLAEIEQLEHRRAMLSAEPDRSAAPDSTAPSAEPSLRGALQRIREGLESRLAPRARAVGGRRR